MKCIMQQVHCSLRVCVYGSRISIYLYCNTRYTKLMGYEYFAAGAICMARVVYVLKAHVPYTIASSVYCAVRAEFDTDKWHACRYKD